jgi:hypothetical protein
MLITDEDSGDPPVIMKELEDNKISRLKLRLCG